MLNIIKKMFPSKEKQDEIVVNYYKKFIGEPQLTYLLDKFKIVRFLGKWEQVFTSRSTGLLGTGIYYSSVNATYSLNNDGTVHVLNSAYDEQFEKKIIEGSSRARDNSVPTCRTVKFDSASIPFEGDYWILDISETFQTIIVVAPIITPYIPIDITNNFGMYVLTKNRDGFWKNRDEVDRIFTTLNKYGFTKFWNEPIVSGTSFPILDPKVDASYLE